MTEYFELVKPLVELKYEVEESLQWKNIHFLIKTFNFPGDNWSAERHVGAGYIRGDWSAHSVRIGIKKVLGVRGSSCRGDTLVISIAIVIADLMEQLSISNNIDV